MDEPRPPNVAGARPGLRDWLRSPDQRDVLARCLVPLVIFACANFAAGTLAAIFRYGTLEVGADRFVTYANPFVLDWGLVHWVSLAPSLWLAWRMLGATYEYVRTAQLALLIGAFGILLMDFDLLTLRFRHIPPLLFFGVDASMLVLLTIILRPSAPVARASVGALGFFLVISFAGLVRDPPAHFEVLRVDESRRGTQYVVLMDAVERDCDAARRMLAEVSSGLGAGPRDGANAPGELRPNSMLILVPATPELQTVYMLAGEVSATRQCRWHA